MGRGGGQGGKATKHGLGRKSGRQLFDKAGLGRKSGWQLFDKARLEGKVAGSFLIKLGLEGKVCWTAWLGDGGKVAGNAKTCVGFLVEK